MIVREITSSEAQKNFGELLMKVNREPFSIKKHNKEVAVIMSSYDFKILMKSKENYKSKKISDFIWSGKNLNRFKSKDEVDKFISNNREIWEI